MTALCYSTDQGARSNISGALLAFPGLEGIVSDSVLQRIASGDQSAVDDCMSQYGNLVWSMALRLTTSRTDAEDATQEIFVDLWRNASRFDSSKASEAGFIAMIARRRLIDMRRRQGRQPITEELVTTGPAATAASLSASSADEAVQIAAVEAMEQLRPEQKAVLQYSVFQGMSHDEIANKTGMPLGTVKTHARRGLIRLRELLDSTSEVQA